MGGSHHEYVRAHAVWSKLTRICTHPRSLEQVDTNMYARSLEQVNTNMYARSLEQVNTNMYTPTQFGVSEHKYVRTHAVWNKLT